MSTSENWGVNRHSERCTIPVSVVSQCKVGVWLRAKETELSAFLWELWLGKVFSSLPVLNFTVELYVRLIVKNLKTR